MRTKIVSCGRHSLPSMKLRDSTYKPTEESTPASHEPIYLLQASDTQLLSAVDNTDPRDIPELAHILPRLPVPVLRTLATRCPSDRAVNLRHVLLDRGVTHLNMVNRKIPWKTRRTLELNGIVHSGLVTLNKLWSVISSPVTVFNGPHKAKAAVSLLSAGAFAAIPYIGYMLLAEVCTEFPILGLLGIGGGSLSVIAGIVFMRNTMDIFISHVHEELQQYREQQPYLDRERLTEIYTGTNLMSIDFAESTIIRLSAREALSFYRGLPDDMKTETVTGLVISKCESREVTDLYTSLPYRLKTYDITISALKRSKPEEVIRAYRSVPEHLRAAHPEVLVKIVVSKCGPDEIATIYAPLPDSLKTEDITKIALRRCKSDEVFLIFEAIPEALQTIQLEGITGLVISKCEPDEVTRLYASLPDSLKKDDVTATALRKCISKDAANLFTSLPDRLQTEITAEITLLRCSPNEASSIYPLLITTMRIRKLEDLTRRVMDMRAPREVPPFYAALPVYLKTDELFELALEKGKLLLKTCEPEDIPAIYASFPEELRTEEVLELVAEGFGKLQKPLHRKEA